MDVNNWKVRMYRFSYDHQRSIWLSWWLLFAGVVGLSLVFLHTQPALLHGLWTIRLLLASVGLAVLVLLALFPLLLFSGLFFVWFRYVA